MRFGILGPFEVADDQGRQLALGGRKQRAVLAILLLHANEVVSSERLIDELWGERPPATAAKTVQVYVSNLRKALGDGVLVTRGGGYVLQTGRAEVDVDRFRTLAAEGRAALQAGDPRPAAEWLRQALELWRGQPLSEFAYEPFAQSGIAELEEARLVALEDRIDADLTLGDHATVVGELEALARAHPLRESLRA
jgi:DNA-binding SARP family transcriptional activator